MNAPLNASVEKELTEKCGVFGILSAKTRDLGPLLYYGLYALQHRGQESCGIAVFDNDQLLLHKAMGLVNQVFNETILSKMAGQVGIGHTRYSTTGDSNMENAQPVVARSPWGAIVLAHNGNLIDLEKLKQRFLAHVPVQEDFGGQTDSHLMARCISEVMYQRRCELLEATIEVLQHCEGAFSVVLAVGDRLIAARDRYGIRPLCMGQTEAGLRVVASETSALDIVGARFERDIAPGEVVVFRRDGTVDSAFLPGERHNRFCIFEYVYFARPDSRLHGQTVYDYRLNLGRLLAQRQPVEADVVIPVPDSGNPAAVGYSQASGIPYVEGLIKNRYVGRTFINPSQELREQGLRLKLNPLADILRGKRVVVVDDSIVRGNTSQRLVQMLREAGVKELHLRISSAPVKHPCFYGIDMSTESELLANQMSLEEIRQWLSVESLAYLTVEDMKTALSKPFEPCTACFTNLYPAGRPTDLAEAVGC
ncbi:MAG: amidophosphoribosyltransferase [Candidatus Melainabacteria bacterium]|nr:amidophosphoribosyltransferase [Candidatus Melainabacteria bacterium]